MNTLHVSFEHNQLLQASIARVFALLITIFFCFAFPVSAQPKPEVAQINDFRFIGIVKDSDVPSPGSDLEALMRASIEVNYSYNGSLGQAYLGAKPKSQTGIYGSYYEVAIPPGQGKNQIVMMTRPNVAAAISTGSIELSIYTKGININDLRPIFSKTVDWSINWPERRMPPQGSNETKQTYHQKLLADAIEIIESSDRLGRRELDAAKKNLDTIIRDDPNNAQAYLELARIAMKSDNAGSQNTRYQGLDEALRLIKVALRVNPGHANAYVLYGYVLAVQKQPDQAIVALKKAQQIGTKNMWLYFNWGLALENANRIDEAIRKYQEGVALTPVIDSPESHYSKPAIPEIYSALMRLLYLKRDLPAIDTLYQRRLAVLNESCQKTLYGQFKLFRMGDYDAAIQKGTQAQEQNCRAGVRPLLAQAYLTKWALDPAKLDPVEREKLLNRAQALIDNTQEVIVGLASSSFTAKVLPKLKDAGIKLDGQDAKGMTPLAYAAAQGNIDSVQALIKAGANADVVLQEGWTPLMIAVAYDHAGVVTALLSANARTDRKTKDGQTALSLAQARGNSKIAKLLSSKERL